MRLVFGYLACLVAGCFVVLLLNDGSRNPMMSRLPPSLGEADVISEGLER